MATSFQKRMSNVFRGLSKLTFFIFHSKIPKIQDVVFQKQDKLFSRFFSADLSA